MPKMDGLAMIRAIKSIKHVKDIPICVCSTESSIEIIKQAKELHVAGWLLKPPQAGAAENVAKKFLGAPRVRAK
jgi:CheY-like chemotaxis protein